MPFEANLHQPGVLSLSLTGYPGELKKLLHCLSILKQDK